MLSVLPQLLLPCLNELLLAFCLNLMEILKGPVPLLKPLKGVRVTSLTWPQAARLSSAPTDGHRSRAPYPCAANSITRKTALTFWECSTTHLPTLLRNETLAT